MMTDNPSAVPIQRPQYNSVQTAQVSIVDACHYLSSPLSYINAGSPFGRTRPRTRVK